MLQSQAVTELTQTHTTTDLKGRHYAFIKARINPRFTQANAQRAQALSKVRLNRKDWSNAATPALANANIESWQHQNTVDRLLDSLQDARSFAEPLLKAALRTRYGLDLDVRAIHLRLYLPKARPWYVLDASEGVITRTVSLLDAALHNFARAETFEAGSAFITRPDSRGHFDIAPVEPGMSIQQFQALCRELDVGALYRQHLESVLLPPDPVAARALKHWVGLSQQAALRTAAHLALAQNHISRNAHELVLGLLHGQTGLTLDGKVMQACDLRLMDTTLTGIMVFIPVEQQNIGTSRVLVYVPHDPEHPLMEYPSASACMAEITRQLRDNARLPSRSITYQQFFSQFVDQQQRGHFFAGLEQRLSQVKWQQKQPFDPGPSWRETPVAKPNLHFSVMPVPAPLWEHLYHKTLNKILNDGRDIAVSTADTDSRARWAWWDNFKKILSDIFNAALMVVTPFIPGLGELMLAYTAYQLTTDVIEGVVDLAEGQWAEAAEHVIGVVTDVIQLAAFAVGGAIGNEFRLKLSPLVEGMTPVQRPDGRSALWNPDLAPYAQKNIRLAADSRPDASGLHPHQGRSILPLNGRHYVIDKHPKTGEQRILHPDRAGAYAPKITPNGRGAWLLEGEQPRLWDSETLMKRLGHDTHGFSPEQLENIRLISGTDEGVLRRMHTEHAPPPLLLDDTFKRYAALRDINLARDNIRAGAPVDPSSYWFEQLVTELPGWPADYALRVYERADLSGQSRTYGNPQASRQQTLSISLGDVMAGKLPERVVSALDDDQLATLLGPQATEGDSVQALRDRLAERVDGRKAELSDYLYRFRDNSFDVQVQRLQQRYPELPTHVAETLLGGATASERVALTDRQHLPLRLRGQARECAFEIRAARASEGFYQAARITADTERLALNVLRLNTETFNRLRIEVRLGTFDGTLRCAVGADDASVVRVLARDERGRYEIRDAENRKFGRSYNLYEAILRALPDDARRELGYQPGQGAWFKAWLRAKTEAPAERRTALLEPPIRPVAQLQTLLLLRGAAQSAEGATLQERVRDLYPAMSEREVEAFVRSLNARPQPLETMTSLEQQLQRLRNILQWWVDSHTPTLPDEPTIPRGSWQHIAERLLQCFERKSRVFGATGTLEGGYALDLSSELLHRDLAQAWKQLPDLTEYLEQITTLCVDNTRLSSGADSLLAEFRHLRQFSARHCQLRRLPVEVGKMHLLETLRLTDNQIELTAEAVEQLRNLTHLEVVRLDDNPLRRGPNVERMPRLKVLTLSNTGLGTWPEGLFNKRRPRGFFLDLQGNPLMEVPRVPPGSDNARVIARTRLSVTHASAAVQQTVMEYRASVGLPRRNLYSPAAAHARRSWPIDVDSSLWGRAPGLGTFRAEAWDNLIMEPNAEGFFSVIDHLTQSSDYRAGGVWREQLANRVWNMIDAMDLDTDLREELFIMATSPTNCADAGAQLFNNMGIKVLASRAYSYSTYRAPLEKALVTLAKGAARLERVDEIAAADVAARGGDPDVVEVYLAYETALAQRLGLPWQSESMLYRPVAGVSDAAIDRAFDTVIEQEQGDGLVNRMLEQPFWEKYLRDTWPYEFQVNDQTHARQGALLEDLREAQALWAQSQTLPEEQRSQPRERLRQLAAQLSIPEDQVFTGQNMSDQAYNDWYTDLAYRKQALARQKTREALALAAT
ncbi:NEL-type E3 ubiquitin ligase domain-containing protein [Pseudomonas sp. SZMC_28357]|uniref:NEL-type E3 ubiquitin ligase domain-containing protein n=1 Tax=Pseudomonas sp. SZMC_28357 TaxID=3074380 RepID=UPI00287125AE|nr:DUF6543 domain-containing protein [Pseudomonas sp. SZMC_28357]MDR9754511.1 NEL-type E3 ubiquitin ligase domain-containing protein [Pseudomonas sp. SZMC_28357]